MKAIEKYVFGSFLSSFLLAFLVLSFVLTIGLLVQIVSYIIDGMPIGLVGKFAAVSFPETLQWTIPLALLVSSILVFSRLSADSEIAAMRACGINLLSVMKYPVLFAAACSLVCMWINNEVVPRGHEVRRSMTSRLSVGNALDLIEPGVWINDFPNFRFYAAEREGDTLYDVEAVSSEGDLSVKDRKDKPSGAKSRPDARSREKDGRKTVYTYHAEKVEVSGRANVVSFVLHNAIRTPTSPEIPAPMEAGEYPFEISLGDVDYKKKAKDLRFFEIIAKIRADRVRIREARELADARAKMADPSDAGEAERVRRLKAKARNERRDLSKTKVELSKRFVFALASICFVLIGVPLGIRAQRKESTVGMAIALAIALGYYLFVMLALNLQKNTALHPEVMIFLPVGVCLGLSAWFVKRNL